jgi:hypothetical protein
MRDFIGTDWRPIASKFAGGVKASFAKAAIVPEDVFLPRF